MIYEYSDLDEIKVAESRNSRHLQLVISNNPFGLDDTNEILIWFNGILVCQSVYGRMDKIIIPPSLDLNRINAKVGLVAGETVYVFSNKSVLNLNVGAFPSYMYMTFFPFNDETASIAFYPQSEEVIQ